MIRLDAMTETDRRCAQTLIESDRRYFEMAAEVEQLSIGQLAWMPGMTSLAASSVVHRIDFDTVPAVTESWVDQMEHALAERSIPLARIYLDDCPAEVHSMLDRRGYERRCEIGFLSRPGPVAPPENMRLCPVRSEDDWRRKHMIHAEAMEGPDGYTNRADLWVEMERRKCATGQMQSYLVRRDDEVVATVGAIRCEGLVRLKNIVVAPKCRQCGIGVATVWLLWQLADASYGCRLGVFGVEGGGGSRLYRRAGLHQITCQHEWSRLLSGKPR